MRIPTATFCFTLIVSAFAQTPPEIEWQRCLGGSGLDQGSATLQIAEGDLLVMMTTNSSNGDVTGNYGGNDIWLGRLNNLGDVLWQRTYGGTGHDGARAIQETNEGGYILAGNTYSNDIDVIGSHGGGDIWVVLVDALGEVIWQRALGGMGFDHAQDVAALPDGGYLIVGETYSTDGDVTFQHGNGDAWVIKLNSNGEVEWQKTLGGSDNDGARAVAVALDGGSIVSGFTFSNDGDVSGNNGMADLWVVKLDAEGNMEWETTLGGSGIDGANDICQSTEGLITATGFTESNDGDVTGFLGGGSDTWVVQLDANGTLLWQKCIGGNGQDIAQSLILTEDGGCTVLCSTDSDGGDVTGHHGESDIWIARLVATGELAWQRALGGTGSDGPTNLERAEDGGYLVTGFTSSNNGDAIGNHGGMFDAWVVKLSADLTAIPELYQVERLSIFPNPAEYDQVVRFNLQRTARVRLEVQDASGRSVLLMDQGVLPPGEQSLTLPMSALRSGAYFVMVHVHDAVFRVQVVKV